MTDYRMNHSDMIAAGVRWLERTSYKSGTSIAGPCPVIETELRTSAWEEPDVLGWHSGFSVLLEAKTSRADFLADQAKPWRLKASEGMGRSRWFITPPGLIFPEEVPEAWGLLWAYENRVDVKKDAVPQEHNLEAEARVLLSIIGRISNRRAVVIDGRKRSEG